MPRMSPDMLAMIEKADRERRMIREATALLEHFRSTPGSFLNLDPDGELRLATEASYAHSRNLTGVPSAANRDYRASRNFFDRDGRVHGFAPGVEDGPDSLRVVYPDGVSEVRTVRDFRASPGRTTPTAATAVESAQVGGSQAEYD